ncbi:hypothetical protein PRIPAC_89756 [Pristionchus pacificus]|uniref:Uncharacterized protein n=1 Tax=Pristionchus pacificus TaxID=54126 RepID=A0A2A6CY74_PRIPA|nr:hypothetical protein PRIPAC_89756 [Pristionchus pacificus]|eukprot:PDM83162.1 hypothetical protein PRIPAC_37555 [Pristionchus pacificus]
MSAGFSTTRLLLGSLLMLLMIYNVGSAPSHCRACMKNCPGAVPSNSTDATDLLEDIHPTNRTKRSSGVEVAPCQKFPIELVLIPLAIAMIPAALCALLICTCCCGPEESRAKKPENMMEAVRKYSLTPSRKNTTAGPSEEFELEYKDGYVQRKDSKMTKFSTTVAYIEPPRRQSIWSLGTMSEPPSVPTSPIRKTPSTDSFKRTRFSDTVTVCDETPAE